MQSLPECLSCDVKLPFGKCCPGGLDQLTGLHVCGAGSGDFVNESPNFSLGQNTHECINWLAIGEGKNSRDILDAHLTGKGLVFLDVYFYELDLTGSLANNFFNYWGQLLAWLTPWRPEINDDRNLL